MGPEIFIAGFLVGALATAGIHALVQRDKKSKIPEVSADTAPAPSAETESLRSEIARHTGGEMFDD
jgi:hypothetical protein